MIIDRPDKMSNSRRPRLVSSQSEFAANVFVSRCRCQCSTNPCRISGNGGQPRIFDNLRIAASEDRGEDLTILRNATQRYSWLKHGKYNGGRTQKFCCMCS